MRYPFIRRAGAMALALIFALTLSLSLTAPAWAADGTLTLTIKSDKEATLKIGEEAALEAEWDDGKGPGEGTAVTYSWACASGAVKLAADEKEPAKAKVTALNAAENVTVTLTAAWDDDGEATATYKLTVMPISLAIAGSSTIVWTSKTENRTLSVLLSGVTDEYPEITWTAVPVSGQTGTTPPTFEGTNAKGEKVTGTTVKVVGTMVKVNEETAGDFFITASYTAQDGKTYENTRQLTISGIVLSGARIDPKDGVLKMYVGGSTTLTVTLYGDADDRNVTQVEWSSSDASVVSVMSNGGNLNAWGIGEAVVKATKGAYSADCKVEVEEDASVIADNRGKGYTASVSDPLRLDAVYDELDDICRDKTDAELRYITNLKVTFTDHGTLYYNYSTESDPGEGVGYNDQFALPASGSIRSVERLYFVPRQGFSGTAEITFSGVAANGRNFTGIIRLEVNMGSDSSGGEEYHISYRARAGEPVSFQADDFNDYCQSVNGRSFNYVIFNLPKAGEGVLYYNYVAGSGNPVTTSMHFTQTGRYAIDNVCFVPNVAFNGNDVIISFRAVDTAGDTVDGTLTVNVVAVSSDDDPSSVTVSGERGQPTALQGELFNFACQATINDTLAFVTFKLPDPDVGVLYLNYQSEEVYGNRVTAGTRCYYSGMPGLNSVSFVPAPGATGRIAISYTGYGSGGASFGGKLYIALDEADITTINYSVAKGGSVTFNASDFYNAGLHQKGVGVNYVTFDLSKILWAPDSDLGALYYNYRSSSNYRRVSSGTYYYYNPRYSSYLRLDLISFRAGDTVGTVTIPYTAVCGTGVNQQVFTGKVVIRVGDLAPGDVNLSCKNSGRAQLSALTLSNACGEAMSGSLSYIEITSIPASEAGRLYFSYNGFRTGTVVKQGERFYCLGPFSIGQLSFVPRAGFTGEAEITYIGYSGDGQEQVSGRIVVSVAKSETSQYFTDMSDHAWAIDSVDYLRRNRAVDGIGGDLYNPGGTIIRGDFTLMLIQAYGFTASGSASFIDVPADSYYADAIRIASLLGIIDSSTGYFDPQTAITRQDAMVMIYNAMKASGKTVTNGLAADFSVYRDEGEIAAYAREAMGSLIQIGVVKGVGGGYLQPLRQITRAEAAVLMHTIMTL